MMRIKDPKPEISRIEELVNRVKIGDIKLPKFQRIFVWKKGDILSLCDSVYRGYPIGSILLWLTNQKLASQRRIGDLEINERPDDYPTNYLLDGQQRLSSLCGALYWDGRNTDSLWNICFDLDKEEFFYPKGDLEVWHFPMNKLLDTYDFMGQFERFKTHPKREKFSENARQLLNSIKDYKIAVVTIGDMEINEVAPIFERINSTGRKLTIVDLTRAATWGEGFDLNDALERVKQALEPRNFEGVPDTEILKNISACAELGMQNDDVDKLRKLAPTDLQKIVEKCVEAYKRAVDFMTSDLPLTSFAYLPYRMQLTFIVEFFNCCPTPTSQQRRELKKWFWKTSFSGYFGVSSYSLTRGILANVRDFADEKVRHLTVDKEVDYQSVALDIFSLNKAISKSFSLLLANQKPRNLLDGAHIDTWTALATANRHEYHHIFPKNYLQKQGIASDRINLQANFCMLNLYNNRKISNQKPSEYFPPLIILLGSDLEAVLKSNYISMDAFEACCSDDYNKFIESRTRTLVEAIKQLTE